MFISTLLLIVLLEIPNININEPLNIDTSEVLALTPDSLFVNQYYELLEFSLEDGALISAIEMYDKKGQQAEGRSALGIQTFAYLESYDLVIIFAGKHLEKGQIASELRLYDRHDRTYEKGALAPQFNDIPVRQFLPTKSGRLFLNLWSRKGVEIDNRLLTEVEISSDGGSFVLKPVGVPFHEQRSTFEPWPTVFKLRWLVEKDEQIYVVNQLQPVLKSYDFSKDKRLIPEESEKYLNLPNWITPFLRKDVNNATWKNSFSRNSGFAQMGDDFIYVYNSPNFNHPDYAKKGDKYDVDVPRHILNLQRLSSFGEKLGSQIQVPGGFFAGVNDFSAVVVTTKKDKATLHFVDLSSL